MTLFNSVFKNHDHPRWIVYLNNVCLSGILVWPFVFFVSIFLFDNPKNEGQTFLWFVLINSYPLLLIALTYLSFKVFRLNKVVSAVFPLIAIGGYLFVLYMLIFSEG